MIISEPLSISSALASEEINPTISANEAKKPLEDVASATVQSLYHKQLLLSRFKIHFAAICKGIKQDEMPRLERNVAVSMCSDLQSTGKMTWDAQSPQWLQKTRPK
jgi:hypothetical protein